MTNGVKEYKKIGPKHKAIYFDGTNGRKIADFIEAREPKTKVRVGPNWVKIVQNFGHRVREVVISKAIWVIHPELSGDIQFHHDENFAEQFSHVGRTTKPVKTVIRKGNWVKAIQLNNNAKDVAHFLRSAGFVVRAGKNWVKVVDLAHSVRPGEWVILTQSGQARFMHDEEFQDTYKEISDTRFPLAA